MNSGHFDWTPRLACSVTVGVPWPWVTRGGRAYRAGQTTQRVCAQGEHPRCGVVGRRRRRRQSRRADLGHPARARDKRRAASAGSRRWQGAVIGSSVRSLSSRRSAAKALRGSSKNTNLPEPLTSFIGRERELVEIKRLLPSKRLLTLVGVGGIGKTRLALQVAAEVMDAYRDGVWLVELGSITDPGLVPTSVAQVLGVQERTGTPLTDTLCAHLKARQLLLILDNCEHLLDACATLADAMLRSGTRSRRSSPPVASRCTSPASRPTRCEHCRCPSHRRAQRLSPAPRRCSFSSNGLDSSCPTLH